MPRLAWIAYYWPECQLGVTAAERSAELVQGLAQRGWDVTVVTKGRCDGCAFECAPPCNPADVTVEVLPSHWITPTSRWQKVHLRLDEFPNSWRTEVAQWLGGHASAFDLLVVSASPYSMIGIGVGHGVPVAIDFRDSLVPAMRWGWRRLLTRIRRRRGRRLARRVDLAIHVTPGEERRDRRLLRGVSTAVVMSASRSAAPVDHGSRQEPGPLTITFAGTFVVGVKTPEQLFATLADVRRVRRLGQDDVRFVFAGRQHDLVLGWAKAAHVEDLVRVEGHLPRDQVEAEYRIADVLLLINGHAPGVPGSKLYEYLRWDRPVLAFGGRDPWLGDLLAAERAGVLLSSADELASWLESALEAKRTGSAYPGFAADAKRATRHSWDGRAAQLDAVLRGVLR